MKYLKEDELLGHFTIWFSRSGAKVTYSDYVMAHPALALGYLQKALNDLSTLIEVDESSAAIDEVATK